MTFTLGHGFALSLALHGALLLPFLAVPEAEPMDEAPLLVVELQGLVSQTQNEQQVQQQTKGAPEQEAQDDARPEQKTQAAQAPTPDQPDKDVSETGTEAAPPPPAPEQKAEQAPSQESATPAEAQSGHPGAANVAGAQEQKQAQTLAQEQDEAERLRTYVKALTKKVQENLAYPDAGRKVGLKGTARVSVSLEADGSVRAGSLKIAEGSGQPILDASALKSVQNSAPFGVPPRPLTVTISVTYGRKT